MAQEIKKNRPASFEEKAYEWRLLLSETEISEEQRRAFEAWLSADLRHEEAYDRAVTLSQACGQIARDEYNQRLLERSPREQIPSLIGGLAAWIEGQKSRLPLGAAAAAALAVLVAVAGLQLFLPDDSATKQAAAEPTIETYSSAIGKTLTVGLDDGSVATLGAASEITVDMRADRRSVTLVSGAVLLNVAADETRPFLAIAGDLSARAIGTVFDVRNNGGVARVAVSEGVVEVSYPFVRDRGKTQLRVERTLNAGQEIAALQSGLGAVRNVSRDAVGAWLDARLAYSGAPVAELVADANRYSTREIILDDPRGLLTGETVTATFDGDNIARLLTVLPDILPISIDEQAPDRIVIRPIG
ncbi:MAG: FecR domain-containing protein [Pseudomonadota bacterium]